MRRLTMAAIRFYQRHLSPHKGFRCAYGVHTGAASCSTLGYRAVRRFGVVGGAVVLRERLHRCGVAHRRHGRPVPSPHRHGLQAGFCDAGCEGCGACDLASCDLASCGVADLSDDCDCSDGCDWTARKRRRAGDDASVHIPVRSRDQASPAGTLDSPEP